MTPAAYVEARRASSAPACALEDTAEPVEPSRRACGFGTVETMRRAFAPPRSASSPGRTTASRFAACTDPKETAMDIAIPLYDRFTALDADRPLRGALAAARRRGAPCSPHEPGPVRTDNGMLADRGRRRLRGPPAPRHRARPRRPRHARRCSRTSALLDWLRERARDHRRGRRRSARARCCSAPPGCSTACEATTHWLALEPLAALRRRRRPRERVVVAGQGRHRRRRVAGHRHGAAAGRRRSRGDDVAQAIQLGIEYDPQPPFDAGSTHKAPPRSSAATWSWPRPAPASALARKGGGPRLNADGAGEGGY